MKTKTKQTTEDKSIKISPQTYKMLLAIKNSTGVSIKRLVDNAVRQLPY